MNGTIEVVSPLQSHPPTFSVLLSPSVESGQKLSRDAQIKADHEKHIRLKKAISLTVAYSANIGGIGSLTGTGPNLVFFAAANQ